MNVVKAPKEEEWDVLLKRPVMNVETLRETVCKVLADVKAEGDRAVKTSEKQFDKVELESLAVTREEMDEAERLVSPELKAALELAHENIRTFHAAQRFESHKVEVCPGVTCWAAAAGLAAGAGAVNAGVGVVLNESLTETFISQGVSIVKLNKPAADISLKSTVNTDADVFTVGAAGGAVAVAAMAYGTETVPKVYKIFGPGNQYVMAAKQQVSLHDVAIDMPAGPSEVAVMADATARPDFVAADLLSQAEHGVDSQVLLVTTDEALLDKVQEEVERQLAVLPRKEIAGKALACSKLILVRDMDEALALVNRYAPEHLIIETADYLQVAERVVNAGSVFLGSYTPESAGDYASGTNHTLPTNGYAMAYNGVNLDSYCRKVTFQELAPQGVRAIGEAVACMAAGEHLDAHRNAMKLRMETIKDEVK